MKYIAKRPFDNGKMVYGGDEVDIPDSKVAEKLQSKGLIEPFYQNKAEKAIEDLPNKAYVKKDGGNYYSVMHEGKEIARHTKSKALKVRDEFNAKL
jgi:hypothetical protein